MRLVIFTHSLASDWNHGHAHFLRGLVASALRRGHHVTVFEPEGAWSAENLRRDHGEAALTAYGRAYPDVATTRRTYPAGGPYPLDVVRAADAVIVQEWNEPGLIQTLGRLREAEGGPRLYFHDAHHRSVSAPESYADLGLDRFDAVLAFGEVVRRRHLEEGWASRAFTWHEAADVGVFRPLPHVAPQKDLLWVGNWGDGERTETYEGFLLGPARRLGLTGTVHGVRYPKSGERAVVDAGLDFAGYLPNHEVPQVMADHRMTVHLPRQAYRDLLPGVPTIRVFEALACGRPLVCTPWEDREGLFQRGDYLVAQTGQEMTEILDMLRKDETEREKMARRGRETVLKRHTCAHRLDEFERIDDRLRGGMRAPSEVAARPTDQATGQATGPANGPAAAPTPSPRAASRSGRAATGPRIAFFGSSLVSSYWNGAATYYRGLLASLARQGCSITFFEPDAYDRQAHRDIDDPDWANVVVYPADDTSGAERALRAAKDADVVIKASGVGAHDAFLEREVLRLKDDVTQVVFWDVDAPATLDRIHADPDDPFARLVSEYDLVCTYGGGPPVVEAYEEAGARRCVPIYNAVDPETHHPVAPDARLTSDLSFLGNRLPDREARVERFFLDVAEERPQKRFVIGGSGWESKGLPANVRHFGHVPTELHNAFNVSARAVLNINRDSMARYGYSPATRVFEAAGAGACIITDAFAGVETFFTPGKEILVAEDGEEVRDILDGLEEERAREIGARALEKVLAAHTYDDRAADAMALFELDRAEVLA